MARYTFLSYKNYRWLWISVFSIAALWVVYGLDTPIGAPSGGSFLGYTYGVLATAGIVYLMWYGVRKRSFYAKATTLKGTLAAHVWIGIALIFLVPLHSGFSFGWNVHTLAYVLMLSVIFSGVWGVVMYYQMPNSILSQRGGGSVGELVEQVNALSKDIQILLYGASSSGEETQQIRVRSDTFQKLISDADFEFEASLVRCLRGGNPELIDKKKMAELVVKLPKEEQEDGLKAITLINKKRDLVCKIQEEARALTWVRAWLYLHLPLSFGLLAALIIHIFSVFFYW